MLNTFDLHLAIIGLETQFLVFLRVAFLYKFYCILGICFLPYAYIYVMYNKQ